jgi:ArsR family transcriptional regulator
MDVSEKNFLIKKLDTLRNIPFEKLEFISIVLKAMSHPVRLKIIEALEINEQLNVQEISRYLGEETEQSLLSHHLITMKNKGILECIKKGQYVYYKLKLIEVIQLLDCLENCNHNNQK